MSTELPRDGARPAVSDNGLHQNLLADSNGAPWRAPYGQEYAPASQSQALPWEAYGVFGEFGGGLVAAGRVVQSRSAAADLDHLLTVKNMLGGFAAGTGTYFADSALSNLAPRVFGHKLFSPNLIDTLGVGAAVTAPVDSVAATAGLIGAAWLAGRAYNYFER